MRFDELRPYRQLQKADAPCQSKRPTTRTSWCPTRA